MAMQMQCFITKTVLSDGTGNGAIYSQNGLNGSVSQPYTRTVYNPYIDTDYLEYISSTGSGNSFSYTLRVKKECDVFVALHSGTISCTGSSYINADKIVATTTYSVPYSHSGHLYAGDTITVGSTTANNNFQCYIVLGIKSHLTQLTNLGQLSGNW